MLLDFVGKVRRVQDANTVPTPEPLSFTSQEQKITITEHSLFEKVATLF